MWGRGICVDRCCGLAIHHRFLQAHDREVTTFGRLKRDQIAAIEVHVFEPAYKIEGDVDAGSWRIRWVVVDGRAHDGAFDQRTAQLRFFRTHALIFFKRGARAKWGRQHRVSSLVVARVARREKRVERALSQRSADRLIVSLAPGRQAQSQARSMRGARAPCLRLSAPNGLRKTHPGRPFSAIARAKCADRRPAS